MAITRTLRHPDEELRLRRVEWGDLVRVDFMAWLEDGSLFDSSLYDQPLEFIAGEQSVIPGINHLVIGMTVGESRTQLLPPDLAFGLYRSDLCYRVKRRWLRAHHIVPVLGLEVEVLKNDRPLMHMIVTELDKEQVTLDANHKLAGKNVMVQLDLLEIKAPANREMHGTILGGPRN
ncbi:MAG: FKBP-type peptidyl-prolyl cis-trans isomerase [Nitrospira sp.]|nr:FKBP-type peptidyl-prolyl cis-trans isomerase [Nitrospira sp.]MBX3335514.1 FKBP-type peptidyl-prolyl cis-trans isomerase [Nitrospira sp.]MDR4462897.1 FKBP-type peptidyl-prolyl cis-trans isomerase [Nitrospira sp.]MDR4467547.1 FKBP-type peptidyl-prolyl cis-trans isomerase [Nitrospira sp.]